MSSSIRQKRSDLIQLCHVLLARMALVVAFREMPGIDLHADGFALGRFRVRRVVGVGQAQLPPHVSSAPFGQ